jgi:hypothetical protein
VALATAEIHRAISTASINCLIVNIFPIFALRSLCKKESGCPYAYNNIGALVEQLSGLQPDSPAGLRTTQHFMVPNIERSG